MVPYSHSGNDLPAVTGHKRDERGQPRDEEVAT